MTHVEGPAPEDSRTDAEASSASGALPDDAPSVPGAPPTGATVNAIDADPRRPARFVVSAGADRSWTVSLDAIQRLRITVGVAIDADLVQALALEEQLTATYDRAVRHLAARPRSVADLHRTLVRKGEPRSHVDAAIARLIEHRLLDDAEYARSVARTRLMGGHSVGRVRLELRRRGVARAVIDGAIAGVVDEEQVDEGESLERVARRKARSLAGVDPAAARRRLYAFLVRRGFTSSEVAGIVRDLVAEIAEGQGADDGDAENGATDDNGADDGD